MALGLSGCGVATPESDDGRTELKLWKNLAGLEEEEATNAAIERFNASQDRWFVNPQSLPQNAYAQSIVAASLSDRMPCIMAVDNPQVARFAWAGHLQPLTGHISEELLETVSPAAIGVYQGETYSVGQFDAALAIFTKRSILERVDVRVPTLDEPWTFEEFQTLLERLKATGDYRYPLDIFSRDLQTSWWVYGYSPFLQSFGGDIVDPETVGSAEGILNGPEGVRFGKWFQSLFEQGFVNRMEPDEYAFEKGRAALSYTGSWFAPKYREYAGDDLLILPPPDFGNGVVIGGGSWQWAISKTCEHPDGAGEFISFLLQPEEVATFSDIMGLIPVTDEGAALTEDFGPGGKNRVFFDLMQRFARKRPSSPAFTEISNAYFKGMRNIMEGKDVQDALDDTVDEIEMAIEASGGAVSAPDQETGS